MHLASIHDVKFLPVIFDVNFPDGLILSHVLAFLLTFDEAFTIVNDSLFFLQ